MPRGLLNMSAIDLYLDDLPSLSEAAVLQAVETFLRIADSPDHRPRENFVLDYKEAWSDSSLHTVDAFAHTFGGLLIVGVSDSRGLPEKIVGVEARGELTTAIASSIATNISPAPRYQIADCRLPAVEGQTPRRLAIIRVQQGNQIHYLTKKGERPIYVRNGDQSIPADAAELRSLIERTARVSGVHESLRSRVADLRTSVVLKENIATDSYGHPQIPTHRQVLLIPFDHSNVLLDRAVEEQFQRHVQSLFLRQHGFTSFTSRDEREADWYEHRWFRSTEHESVWRITSEGDMGYATQARVQLKNGTAAWSIGDTIADVVLMLKLASEVWRNAGFYGEARLLVSLNVQELPISIFSTFEPWLLNPTAESFRAVHDFKATLEQSFFPASRHSPTATATADFNAGVPFKTQASTVASVMNRLLRSMKHSTDLKALQRGVEFFINHGTSE